ncbi:MAG: hypothetical protein EB829_03530, partial [Nitrosopumilus sp. H8]
TCIFANRVEFSMQPVLGKNLIKNNRLDDKLFKSWTELPVQTYYKEMAEIYAKCLKEGEGVIRKKVKKLNLPIVAFVSGIVWMPIAVILAII